MFTKIQRNKNVWDQKNKNQPDKLGIKRGNNISWKRKKQRAQWYIEIQKKWKSDKCNTFAYGFSIYHFFLFSNILVNICNRYIAVVYVYRYVWKQTKLKNGKPVRKRIAFVILPFFLNLYISLCSLLLSFSRYIVCSFNS